MHKWTYILDCTVSLLYISFSMDSTIEAVQGLSYIHMQNKLISNESPTPADQYELKVSKGSENVWEN